jgi:signal transduction histidine kinase/DNA-binding response OmpR family regulator
MRILGYDPKEAVKSGDFNLITDAVLEEDLPKLRQAIQTLTRVGDSTSVSYRVRHKDGGILNVVSRIKLLEEDGELLYQRFMIDYTAEATRQKWLDSEKEKRHLEIIYALGREYNSLYYIDLDTGICTAYRLRDDVYRPFESFFSKEFMLEDGATFYCQKFVHPDDREMFLAATQRDRLLQEMSSKSSVSLHYRAVYENSGEFIQMKIVRAGAWGKHHNIIMGFRNVDEEFSREREQKHKLEAALEKAEQASQAKTTFLHNVSHDIRTPLNAIVGFTNLASTHLDNREQAQAYLDKVTIASKHLLALIDDVLDMSRIESGKLRLELSPCDLLELLYELKTVIIGQICDKQLDFSIDTTAVQNELVLCDMHCLQQILLNLVGNAVKFTKHGGSVALKIIQKPASRPGYGLYEFRVKDTGIGMSPEFQSHVFDMFSRERSTTASGIPGTGLGLAIAKNLATAMGGDIQVFSTPGKGTEFVVTLEFVLPPEQPHVSAVTALHGTRALVVDNNFHTCENLSRSLDKLGVQAEWTMSGTEALLLSRRAAAQNEPFHVYIVDWALHDRSSYTLIQHLREEQGAAPRIIVLIPYGQDGVEQDAKAAGATALCSKPVLRYELRDLLLSSAPSVEMETEAGDLPTFSPRKRLLLAEDNELNQEIASELLQEHGFLVEIAENGLIAVNMVKQSPPDYYDAILMDIQMPKMNGYEATRAIRALEFPYHANIPIIAMSANAFTEDKKLALASGMNHYITKPFDPAKLLFALHEIGLS